ncbi:hypothetical protein [Ancrocorticia sp.]
MMRVVGAILGAGLFAYGGVIFVLRFFSVVMDSADELFIFGFFFNLLGTHFFFPLLFCFVVFVFILTCVTGVIAGRQQFSLISAYSCALFGATLAVLPPQCAMIGYIGLQDDTRARVFCALFALVPLLGVALNFFFRKKLRADQPR